MKPVKPIDRILEGLKLIAPYDEDGWSCHAEHDVFYAANFVLPEEIQSKLRDLGWHYDKENTCWAIFC